VNQNELLQLVDEVRSLCCEFDAVEVKLASTKVPRRLFEVISAFANSDEGGVIIFGLDEANGFEIVGVADPQKLQSDVTSLAQDQMDPSLKPTFAVVSIDGRAVVGARVPSLSPSRRPCYFKDAGLPKGAFMRVGPSNRQMSNYEVQSYLSNREQPKEDEQPVRDADVSDLDVAAIDAYLERLRKARPDAAYSRQSREKAMVTLRIARELNGGLRPTLGGLLMFGEAPEIVEPQLMISFVQYAGADKASAGPAGERFLDNKQFVGPIPTMVDAVESYILAHVRTRTLITGLLRQDIPEYPRAAVREALINAVAHRDYGAGARGSHIQVKLFSDRLEISSPGGLYGNVTLDTLEESQSARNRQLVRMMQDMQLVENRGSGIDSMIEAMRSAGLEPPRFSDDRKRFTVAFRSHALMLDDDGVAWLNAVAGQLPLNDRQKLALVYLRRHRRLTNQEYRRLHPGLDSRDALQELRGLVQCGAAVMRGVRGGAWYDLALPIDVPVPERPVGDEDRILDYVRQQGFIQAGTASALLGWGDARRAGRFLRSLVNRGLLLRQGQKRWTRYVLR